MIRTRGTKTVKLEDFQNLESLRAGIKKDLDDLPPGQQLSTTEMVEYVMAKSGAEPGTKFLSKLLYDAVRNRPYAMFPGYTTRGTPRPGASRFTKNKMVTPALWHCRGASQQGVTCPHCQGTGVTGLDKATADTISDETPLEELK